MNDPREVRHAIRARRHTGHTAGLAPGRVRLPELGEDLDIRTDVPRYRIFVDGSPSAEVENLEGYWRDDLVTFVLGCSFSFEEALMEAGLPLRYVEQGRNVPMYRADAIRAIEITSRYPRVHGSPVHLGRPDLIGIDELSRPWVGDPTEVRDDEVPLFWACGVTPQSVALDAKPSLCITHAPGHMLVTDLENRSLAER